DDDQSVLLTNMIAQFKKLVGPQSKVSHIRMYNRILLKIVLD
ncbi:unnamed protein product, partial [Adineta steineri]